MAEEPEVRKQRKSVAFDEEKLVVAADGSVEVMAAPHDEKDTAMSHSPSTPSFTAALASTNSLPAAAEIEENGTSNGNEAEDGGLDLTLKKKKKKPKKEEVADEAEDTAEPADDGGLDLSLKKKKKKKVAVDGDDEFAQKLKELKVDGEAKDGEEAGEEVVEGDMEAGTGIWEHDYELSIPYAPLLDRFFVQLAEKNPDHMSSGAKNYKIPPPQCLREGNKKTIFANIAEICKRMKRSDEHVTAYLFAELGTSGSTDGSRRLVIKGRFQQKMIENVLRKYIIEYVSCKTCRSPDTELSKGENRLYFVTCNSCGSRRSVSAIKTGFSAQVGKRKKMRA